MKQPTEEIAKFEVEHWANQQVLSIRRFPTGNHHYVYDVSLADGKSVVIRMALPHLYPTMNGALYWNEQLRNLGLPLPKLHLANVEHEFPYIIMDRLPGTDLGFVLDTLTIPQQKLLTKQLMDFQRKVGKLPSAGRYGYGDTPLSAPYASWPEVLMASLKRSKKRILETAFVDVACIDRVEAFIGRYRQQLNQIKAIPFLHDITTKNVIIHEGNLSGIVDVDTLCYGDPLYHIGLTQMGILSQYGDLGYVTLLIEAFGEYSPDLLNLYTAVFCIDFLSELGQKFNGNVVEQSESRKKHLMSILDSLLADN